MFLKQEIWEDLRRLEGSSSIAGNARKNEMRRQELGDRDGKEG